MELVQIGSFMVDSGQAIVGDPCYLEDWKPWNSEEDNFEDHVNKVGEYGYLGACNATITNQYGQLGAGSAVAFNTGHGDGFYPVYAKIVDGIIQEVVIKFTDEEQD